MIAFFIVTQLTLRRGIGTIVSLSEQFSKLARIDVGSGQTLLVLTALSITLSSVAQQEVV